MTYWRSGNARLLVRIAIYLLVIAVIFLLRGGLDWRYLLRQMGGAADADTTLTLAGGDLAPELLQRVIDHYRRDYPRIDIQIQGGGSSHALEALVNGRADVAFLNRQPSPQEQELFLTVVGDTVLWYPIALGSIVLLRHERAPAAAVTLADLESFTKSGSDLHFDHLYVSDPNLGLWDAFRQRLGLAVTADAPASHVIFLQDDQEVMAAVAQDAAALGLVSSLTSSLDSPEFQRQKVCSVPVLVEVGGTPASADDEEVASGAYPLYHFLYVVSRKHGGIQGTKFVTHLTSDRGQKQIERAGYVPARMVLREIYLTRHPLGR